MTESTCPHHRDGTATGPCLHLVVAVARNGGIGLGGRVPWDYESDRRQYRRRVDGHPVVVGRRTFDRLDPLPNSRHLVLTRDPDREAAGPDVEYVRSPGAAVAAVRDDLVDGDPLYVIGGEAVYAAFLPYAHRASVSEIPEDPDVDRFFPYLGHGWRVADRRAFDRFDLLEYVNDEPRPIGALPE